MSSAVDKYGYGASEPYYTTAHTQPVQVVTEQRLRPWFYPWYLATIPGGAKVLQIVGGGGAMVAILLINGAFWGTYIACATALVGFSCSLVLLLMNLYNLVPLVTFFDIPFWSVLYVGSWTFMYAIATGIMVYSSVTWRNYRVQWGAAAACCLLALVACAIDFVCQIRERRQNRQQPDGASAHLYADGGFRSAVA